MNDSVDMPVKKKRKQSDTRMLTALQLRYRAIQDTDKSVIDDSTYWLIQGGYTEEDKNTLGVCGWRHLCNNFSQQWYLYKKKNPIPEEQKPLWEHDFMKKVAADSAENQDFQVPYHAIIDGLILFC